MNNLHITMKTLLMFCALVCFILAVFNVPKVNWVALGLAFMTASFLIV